MQHRDTAARLQRRRVHVNGVLWLPLGDSPSDKSAYLWRETGLARCDNVMRACA